MIQDLEYEERLSMMMEKSETELLRAEVDALRLQIVSLMESCEKLKEEIAQKAKPEIKFYDSHERSRP